MTGKRVTVVELAAFFGVERHTIARKLKKEGVNLRDIQQVLKFVYQNRRDNGTLEAIKKPDR